MGDLAERLEALKAAGVQGEWLPADEYDRTINDAIALAQKVEGAEVCVVPPESFTTAVLNNHAREPLRVALVPVEGGGSRG
jgi:hypothetical protein